MKAYTDIEQSKKLVEILPLESADMFYTIIDQGLYLEIKQGIEPSEDDIPCWSLVALLNILPCPSLHKTFGGWRCDSYNKEGSSYILGKPTNDPIDTIVEMIINFKKLNLL